MDATFLEALRLTAADDRLSRAERGALKDALHAAGLLHPTRLAALRDAAFQVARERIEAPAARETLAWLERVVELLAAQDGQAATHHAEALFSPRDDCAGRIAGLFQTAARSADACVYTITDDRIAGAMLDAHRRGVQIRVLSDDAKALDLGSDLERLAAAGIDVRLDTSPFHMHHKFAVFDGSLLVNGSYNWTRAAASSNAENLMVTDDPRLVAGFQAEFERLWRAHGSKP